MPIYFVLIFPETFSNFSHLTIFGNSLNIIKDIVEKKKCPFQKMELF